MVKGAISFGRFRLDLARRELRRDEAPVRLGSRALDILCVLASAGGKVVSKDELMERVWAGVVDDENNIQVHISALRKALEEDKNGKGGLCHGNDGGTHREPKLAKHHAAVTALFHCAAASVRNFRSVDRETRCR
jgi:hypothetical protein